MIAVVHFGAQYGHLIARRIRELSVHSEIVPHTITAEELFLMNPDGIILSGGPSSVYGKAAPQIDRDIFKLNIPILGICYGMQLIAKQFGTVLPGKLKEYGKTTISVKKNGSLLKGLAKKGTVWMSHGDLVKKMGAGFATLASTKNCPIASFENKDKKLYGIQFHAEVAHTPKGKKIFENFVFDICNAEKNWNIQNFSKKLIAEIKQTVGNKGVIMGLSGGVDSTVAATLLHTAIGKNLYCVFIDHGFVRKDEAKKVMARYKKYVKFKHLIHVDASTLFLKKLKNISDPEQKRKIIGHTFIEVFEKQVKKLSTKNKNIRFLGQGTIYPDRVESAQPTKQASKIKSHHNVTLPKKMKLAVIEPLKELYKDEVRKLGLQLKLPREMVNRHPFPGPGLAIRILGAVTPSRLRIVREADAIFIEELRASGYYDKTWQAFAALFPVKTVGVKGDARTYEYIISLRAITSVDAMTADWARLPPLLLEKVSSRIMNEVAGVNRVVFDISQKPPATIEYE